MEHSHRLSHSTPIQLPPIRTFPYRQANLLYHIVPSIRSSSITNVATTMTSSSLFSTFKFSVFCLLVLCFTCAPAPAYGRTPKMEIAQAIAEGAPALARELSSIASDVSDNFVQTGDRSKFAISVVRHFMALKYNSACIHPLSLGNGWDMKFVLEPRFRVGLFKRTIRYTCYVARRNKRMVVTNTGDGGFINWAYGGWGVKRDGGRVQFN